MSIKSDVIIHTGFCKTGTTTLQDCFFSKHDELNYLGKHYSDTSAESLISDLRALDDIYFNPSSYKDFLNSFRHRGGIFMISDESLSYTINSGNVLTRLNDLFPNAKIIVTIREQISLLQSVYSNHRYLFKDVPTGHEFSITFSEWLEYTFNERGHGYIGTLCFNKYIDYAVKVFGKENVGVFLFEDFVKDSNSFLTQLSRFIGIEDVDKVLELMDGQRKNSSRSNRKRFLETMRVNYPVIWKVLKSCPVPKQFVNRFMSSGTKETVKLPTQWQITLSELYKNGNRSLQEKYNLPLTENGYLS